MGAALDAITANITGAWGMRQLLSAYAGNLFQADTDSTAALDIPQSSGEPNRETLRNYAAELTTFANIIYDQKSTRNFLRYTAGGGITGTLHARRAPVAMGDRIAVGANNTFATAAVTGTDLITTTAGTVFTVIMLQRNQGTIAPAGNVYGNPAGWGDAGQNYGIYFRETGLNWGVQAYGYDGAVKCAEVLIPKADNIYRPIPICWRIGSGVIRCKVYDNAWSSSVAIGTLQGLGAASWQMFAGAADGMWGELVSCNAAISDANVDAVQLEQATYWRRFVASGSGGGISRARLVNAGGG